MNFEKRFNQKGQILVITLLVVFILSIVVLTTSVNLTRDIQQRVYNEAYEQNYYYSESRLYQAAEAFKSNFSNPNADVSTIDLQPFLENSFRDPLSEDSANVRCEKTRANNADKYNCNIEEGNITTDLELEVKNSIEDLELNGSDAMHLNLAINPTTSYSGNINLKWEGNVIWSYSLIFLRNYNGQYTYEVLNDVYDGANLSGRSAIPATIVFTVGGNYTCPGQTSVPTGNNAMRISLTPANIKGLTPDDKLVYLRLRPIIVGGDSTKISLCGDTSLPPQFVNISSQSYQKGIGLSSPTPYLSVKTPLYPAPPGIFDYVYYSNN